MYYLKGLNVIKDMISVQRATIEMSIHLGGPLSSSIARVALGFCLLRFSYA